MESRQKPKRQLSLKLGQQKLSFGNELAKSKPLFQNLSAISEEESPLPKNYSSPLRDYSLPRHRDGQSIHPLCSGLCNLGNTCYVNSVLQVLRFCPKLLQGVSELKIALATQTHPVKEMDLEGPAEEDEDESNSLFNQLSKVLWEKMAYKESLFHVANKPATIPASKPCLFLDQLRAKNKLFDNKFQHDAQEMLHFLLTDLQDTYKSAMNLDLSQTQPPPMPEAPLLTSPKPTSTFVVHNDEEADEIKDKVVGNRLPSVRKFSNKQRHSAPCNMNGPPRKVARLSAGRAETVRTNKKIDVFFRPVKSSLLQCSDDRVGSRLETESWSPSCPDFVSQIFQGSLAYQTKCFECENMTRRTESFLDISLPVSWRGFPGFPALNSPAKLVDGGKTLSNSSAGISSVGPYSLSWCLSQFALREKLRGENKYHCDECGRFTEAERSVLFSRLPSIMNIHLNRFATERWGLSSSIIVNKVGGNIAVPLALRFRSWSTEDCKERDKVYQLFGIIFHSGSSCQSGHYTACVRARECVEAMKMQTVSLGVDQLARDGWLFFDDESVEYISQSVLLSLLSPLSSNNLTAYILFYSSVY